MLAGNAEPSRLYVCEGITDYLAIAGTRTPDLAVIGAASGGFQALAGAKIPKRTVVYVGTDNDPAGDAYAEQVRVALPNHDLRRVRVPVKETRGV